jgi:hypothetical protein
VTQEARSAGGATGTKKEARSAESATGAKEESRSGEAATGKKKGAEIDIPEVKAEVEAAFAGYERALVSNDVATLDRLFLDRPTTIRYGIGENLYGYAEIAAFRAARSPLNLARTLERTVITTFGRDFAVAATLFRRTTATGKIGRQMQSWVRTTEGWRVAGAHVSIINEP